MDTYNGTDLILMIETTSGSYKPIAEATGHTLAIDRENRETSSKSTGQSTGREYGRYSWNVSLDALLTFKTDVANFALLVSMAIAGTKIKVISVLLDYETAGKAPMSDTVAAVVRDATGDDNLDEDSVDVETTNDNFAMTSVFASMTPWAYYGVGCLSNVQKTATDGETVSFTAAIDGDNALVPVEPEAFAP